MLDLSPIKILIIVAVILLVMGPNKLPEVAQRLGAGWRALRKLQQRVEAEVREAIPDLPSASELARLARSPVNLLNQLADKAAAPPEEPAPGEGSLAGAGPEAESAPDAPLFRSDLRPSPPPPSANDWASLPPDPSLN
jgi:TatA/E family protein of Tat protein translocase